jgi:hypothetical protein
MLSPKPLGVHVAKSEVIDGQWQYRLFVKFFVKLCAVKAPKTPLDSSLSY